MRGQLADHERPPLDLTTHLQQRPLPAAKGLRFPKHRYRAPHRPQPRQTAADKRSIKLRRKEAGSSSGYLALINQSVVRFRLPVFDRFGDATALAVNHVKDAGVIRRIRRNDFSVGTESRRSGVLHRSTLPEFRIVRLQLASAR